MTITAYRDHPIRVLLQQMLELQGRSEFADPVVADNETYAFAREKVFALTSLVEVRLAKTPAVLASSVGLSNLQSHLQSPFNELNAFLTNKNPGHLTNAASQLEQNVLPLLWALPSEAPDVEVEVLGAALDRQSATVAETIRQLTASRDQLASALADSAADVQSLESQVEQIGASAAKERAEASAAVANLQKSYAEKEIERSAAFAQEIANLKAMFTHEQANLAAAAGQRLADLDDQRDRAAKIVQVVGNIGVTGNYQRIANDESAAADVWRWITIGIFVVGIVFASVTFYWFLDEPLTRETLWSVLVRLLYAIAVTAPAWYSARESARHRSNADRARQTELELASIGPFIELLPESKKIEIKEGLTKAYFGRPVDAHVAQTPLEALPWKELVELVKAAKK
jgi:hypothetical protein